MEQIVTNDNIEKKEEINSAGNDNKIYNS